MKNEICHDNDDLTIDVGNRLEKVENLSSVACICNSGPLVPVALVMQNHFLFSDQTINYRRLASDMKENVFSSHLKNNNERDCNPST